MTYDFALDMDTDNSLSIILRHMRPRTRVLEFGSAHGRMTRYMREQLGCKVFIVEKDVEAGTVASQYAEHHALGADGEIEGFLWEALVKPAAPFDHIMFADVLEHLADPWAAVARAAPYLAPQGTMWISVPNLAHNAVLIDLLRDRFEYRSVGLLDRTHLRFFTVHSLRDLVARAGLVVVQEVNAINQLQHTELKNSYADAPTPEVRRFLKGREYGEVYQFVWELARPAGAGASGVR